MKVRKNKKGFTLIELLAVIVILAVIALIAVPQILRILKQARLSAAEDTTYGVVESTESYVANLMLTNSGNLPVSEYEFECDETGCYLSDSIKSQLSGYNYEEKLNFKGTTPKSGTITVTQNGTIVTATDLQINEFLCQYTDGVASCGDGNGTSTTVQVSEITSYEVTATTSSININIEAKDTENGFIKVCHYLYDSTGNTEITHECIESLNNTNTYSNTNSYTFNGNVNPGTTYKVKTEMYMTTTRILTSDIKTVTTLAIGQPTITSGPSGWSQSKTVTINYNGNETFEYYFYTSDIGTSNIGVVSCGNTLANPSICDTNEVTSLTTGYWYKTSGNVEITYNTEGSKSVIARTQDNNGKFNFAEETISRIDITAPSTPEFTVTANGDSIEVNIITVATDVSTVKYKYSKDNGSTWEPSNYTTNTTYTFSNLADGDYNIVVKAVNETVTNNSENSNNTTVTGATLVSVITSVPEITSYLAAPSTSSIIIDVVASNQRNGFIKACHYLYDSSDVEITHDCVENLNGVKDYNGEYTFSSNVDPGTSYKVKTEMYITNSEKITSEIKEVTTLEIGQPTITSSPSGWSQSKTVTISYNGENLTNPEYYFYTSDIGTSNINVVTCGNNSSAPNTCDTNEVTNLTTGYWYKTSGNVEITYNIEGSKSVIARTYDGNGKFNYASATISYIDKTAPKVTVDTTKTQTKINSITLTYSVTDKLADNKTAGSGVDTANNVYCYYRTSSGTYNNTNRVKGNATTCTMTGLTAGTTYYYKVNATDNVTLTGSSQEASTTTLNAITFANQSKSITYITSSKTITISEATGGTGEFTYSEVSEKKGTTDTNYFSISGTTITANASTPAGTYTYVVRATDKLTGDTKTATITITVNQATLVISVTDHTTTYPGAISFTFESNGDGTFSVTNSNTSAADVSIRGKKITIKPKSNPNRYVTGTVRVTHSGGKNIADGSKSFSYRINRNYDEG